MQTTDDWKFDDRKLKLFGVPIVAVMMNFLLHKELWYDPSWELLKELGVTLIFTFILWEVNCIVYLHARKKYPGFTNTKKRIRYQAILAFTFTILADVVVALVLWSIKIDDESINEITGPECYIYIFIPVIVLTAIYESVYFFHAWKDNVIKSEKIASAHLETQFEALKKQLDPHFLFNSLNTLASLIDHENEPAQEYLEHLSDVYRYVLETRNRTTVYLYEELEFLNAYLYLNEIRFRENIQVDNEIPRELYQYHIPALSLQTLVENAIKHNMVSREKPLFIRIFKDGDYITVSNNKQIKTRLEKSTGLGLNNLIQRYQLLTKQPVKIQNQEDQFIVSLPILNPSFI